MSTLFGVDGLIIVFVGNAITLTPADASNRLEGGMAGDELPFLYRALDTKVYS